jgi:uncharacterized protein
MCETIGNINSQEAFPMKTWGSFPTLAGSLVLGLMMTALWVTQPPRAAAAVAAQAAPSPMPAADCDGSRSVQVSGAATINIIPDRVLLKLGVQSNNRTPELVQADNQAAMQRVLAAARGLGIADKDISTDYYLVQPIYENYDALTIKGYRIDNLVAITLNDVSRTSAVLIAALKAGANQVLDVQFYTSQLRQYRDQARNLAMKAAAEKAQALAEAGGAQTGCLMHIDENTWSYYTGYGWGSRNQALWAQNVVQNATGDSLPGGDGEAPISIGQIAVQAQVNTTFSLR